MKKFIACLMCVVLLFFTGCQYKNVEQPKLYTEEITATVTCVDRNKWNYYGQHWRLTISAYNEEYDLYYYYNDFGDGNHYPEQWHFECGDIVKATLCVWKYESNGRVVNMYIDNIYE